MRFMVAMLVRTLHTGARLCFVLFCPLLYASIITLSQSLSSPFFFFLFSRPALAFAVTRRWPLTPFLPMSLGLLVLRPGRRSHAPRVPAANLFFRFNPFFRPPSLRQPFVSAECTAFAVVSLTCFYYILSSVFVKSFNCFF